jgi:hypothetical protein
MTLKVRWKLLNINVIFENPEIQKSKTENPEIQKPKKGNPVRTQERTYSKTTALTWAACVGSVSERSTAVAECVARGPGLVRTAIEKSLKDKNDSCNALI